MQMYLKIRIGRAEFPPVRGLECRANFGAIRVAVELIVDVEVSAGGLQAPQMLVGIVECGHVNREPAAGLCPISQLVSDHIFRLEILVPRERYHGGDDQEVPFEARRRAYRAGYGPPRGLARVNGPQQSRARLRLEAGEFVML